MNKTAKPQPQPAILSLISTASGFLAIVSLFISASILFIPTFILATVAIITGIIALKKEFHKGPAIAGILTGASAFIFSAAILLFFTSFFMSAGNYYDDKREQEQRERTEKRETVNALKKDFAVGETGIFGDIEVKIIGVQPSSMSDPADPTNYRTLELEIINTRDTRQAVDRSDFSFITNQGRTIPALRGEESGPERARVEPGATLNTTVVIYDSEYTEGTKLQYETRIKNTDAVFTLAF